MRPTITMDIRQETYEELLTLADTLGYPPEAAMSYAVRLVNACIREGLLTDIPTLRDETEPKAAARLSLFQAKENKTAASRGCQAGKPDVSRKI